MTGHPRRATHLLGLALAGVLLAGCGDEPGLDVAAVEEYLVQSQAAAFGELEIDAASCPDEALREGMILACTLEVADAEVPYRLRLRDVREPEVRVDVTLDAVVLLQAKLEQYVVSTLPDDFSAAELACAGDVIVAEVGDTVECTVAAGAQTKPVTLTVEDEAGRVSIA